MKETSSKILPQLADCLTTKFVYWKDKIKPVYDILTGVRVNLKRTAVSDTETNQAIKITGPEGIIFFVPKRFTIIKL